MNKKLLCGISAAVLAVAVGLSACSGSAMPEAVKARNPDYGADVAVHDPSIFKDDDGKYYAFGTHFAVATSTDLIKWTQYAYNNQWNKLYNASSWKEALKETVDVVQPSSKIGSTWAPDVIKHGGKYYMYYSLTNEFGSNKSAIGRVEADSVTGPYSNNKVLISSSGASGVSNAIDPTVFWDQDGKLWMVYGSAFGGIRLVELNNKGDKFGLPKDEEDVGDNAGELLWTGSSNNAEGPYIFYNSETKYYYLMVSYGNLETTYNMRIARSKEVAGPYVDITGEEVQGNSTGGNKLAGNYKFEGDSANYALGHNSVLVEDGNYFVVMHVRNALKGMHHLEVRQLYFTEEGWPVLAPNRYANEKFGTIDPEEFCGDYDVVVHTGGITADVSNSTVYTFAADGKIKSGDKEVGEWTLTKNCYLSFTLNGNEYQGVVASGWSKYNKRSGLTITATDLVGNALWANPIAR